MAEKIVGITLNGANYDYEDEETKELAGANAEAIGDLSELETEEKTSLVGAINELAAGGDGVKTEQILNIPLWSYGPGLDYYRFFLTLRSDGIAYGHVTYNSNYTVVSGNSLYIAADPIEREAGLAEKLARLFGENIFPSTGTSTKSFYCNAAFWDGEPGIGNMLAGTVGFVFTLYPDKTAQLRVTSNFFICAVTQAGTHGGANPSYYFVAHIDF